MVHKIQGMKAFILNTPDKGDPLNTMLQLGIVAFVDGERRTWSSMTEQYISPTDKLEGAIERTIVSVIHKILADLEVSTIAEK